jgi:3-oxosteroid 1-dehydrogenase
MPRAWVEQGYLKEVCWQDWLGSAESSVGPSRRRSRSSPNFCQSGVDEDYERGNSAYNRFYADPTKKPNPCLGTIAEPPFWAAPLYPGDVGTCGGAIVDEHAQVMRSDGSVIGGLYAAGNCAASLCGPHYVGTGQSIGAASVFGFIAANTAAR